MADTDRELLELAAKAAGIVLGEHARFIGDLPQLWFYNDSRKHPMCRKPSRPGNVPWAPLADDGDALRLAVKLGIDVTHKAFGDDEVMTSASEDQFDGWFTEPYGADRLAATRRAIVRAAAEMVRNKTPNAGHQRRAQRVRCMNQLGGFRQE